jgi:hypothetical protein
MRMISEVGVVATEPLQPKFRNNNFKIATK